MVAAAVLKTQRKRLYGRTPIQSKPRPNCKIEVGTNFNASSKIVRTREINDQKTPRTKELIADDTTSTF